MARDSTDTDAPEVVPSPDLRFERRAARRGAKIVAGVDEAGRGPLAGPVVVSAVILNRWSIPEGLNDSKVLTHLTSVLTRTQWTRLTLQSIAQGAGIPNGSISIAMTRLVNAKQIKADGNSQYRRV